MLVLVRLLSPQDYGRATAVTGIFAVLNCFNCAAFIAQAMQLPQNETPDWGTHWTAGFYIQFALCTLCNTIAALAWLLPAYRAIAPVLHVASIGLLIDVPCQMANIRLRRAMNFRTLRIVHASATLVTVVSSIGLALAGAGAYALIISSNVLHGVAFGFYLLAIERWRPPRHWWARPDWRCYRAPLRFGAQQSGSAVLAAARAMLETVVIPPMLGYEALGLLNRAQILFTTTIGRATTLVVETVYPMLPRIANQPEQFARHATLFVQTMLLLSVPGAVFVGIEGRQLSRLLYGAKWIAADPLIWPGTVFAWGVATVLVFVAVLQAQNRLRLAFISSAITAAMCLPGVVLALTTRQLQTYSWALAAGQMAATVIVLRLGSTTLRRDWLQHAVFPAAIAAIAGAAVLILLQRTTVSTAPLAAVLVDAGVFGSVALLVLRICFPAQLREVLVRLPTGQRLQQMVRL